jgi:hypothetical protein
MMPSAASASGSAARRGKWWSTASVMRSLIK